MRPVTRTRSAGAASDRRRWLGLSVLLVAAFMDLLDGNIVNVTVPSIQKDLGASYADTQWIIVGYVLACAVVLITGGRLGDIYGRRRMFLIGTAGFTLASALCALAQSPETLIGARVLQGGMTAVMLPQVLAIIHLVFDRHELGRVVGMYASIGGLALVGGPVIGGLLVSWNPLGLEWRSVFVVNLPVGVVTLLAARSHVDESRAPDALRPDVGGTLLATFGLLLLVCPLARGRELGWPTWSIVSLIASAPVFALFVAYERHKTRSGGSPLVVLALFRDRRYTAGLIVQLVLLCVPSAFFLTWTLYLQLGLDWSPLRTGLTTVPFSLGASIAGGLSMRLLFPRFGRDSLMAGAAIMTAGLVLYGWAAERHGVHVTSWQMVVPLLLIGIGLGQVIVPLTALTLADVPARDAGAASGMINATSQLGSVLGVALIGLVFFTAIGREAAHSADQVISRVRVELSRDAELPRTAQEEILAGFRACVIDATAGRDPSSEPASCRRIIEETAADRKTTEILAAAATHVRHECFARSFQCSLWCVVAAVIAVLALMLALPRRPYSPGQEERPA